ncbi:CREB-binding protein [Orchesella cincta]|uniref:histone acetyltransferase n=1 Tax=Orchesella cincta TaxID=48709 RepID=A0A1D2MPD6_ORCCI|nr:CREB-binding protein [Orchesella cincta]
MSGGDSRFRIMKDNSKPSGKVALVDTKPISIPIISSSTTSAAGGGGAIVKSVSISRSQGCQAPVPSPSSGMVSIGTQTGEESQNQNENVAQMSGEELQEKRRLIRKQLAVLLHAVLCRVRDELIGNTGESARPCPTAFCGLMKTVLNHLRTCDARLDCPHPHCASSRQILNHWKQCTQADCPVCSSLRRVVPAYLEAVVSNPRWRDEIMSRFQWLIRFIGPINMRMPPTTISPIHLHHASRLQAREERRAAREESEENNRNNQKDCEE